MRYLFIILLFLFSIKNDAQTIRCHPFYVSQNNLFLDLYPSATVAFSLRKLNTSYSGNCIRVRRSSDNTEQDIGFVNNYLDTASMKTFVGANNGFVTTLYDQSGNTRNAAQATQANQSQIIASGVINKQGTFPCLKFDNTDFYSFTYPNTGATSNDVFYVNYLTGTSFIMHTTTSPYGYVATSGSTNTTLYGSYGTPSLYINGSLKTPTTRNDVYSYYNNVFALTTVLNCNLSSSFWATTRISGYSGSLNFVGNMLEFIIYNSTNSSNRSAKESNINSFYSIY